VIDCKISGTTTLIFVYLGLVVLDLASRGFNHFFDPMAYLRQTSLAGLFSCKLYKMFVFFVHLFFRVKLPVDR